MKKHASLAAFGIVAALLVGIMSIAPAWSYFTANATAIGGLQIKVEPKTDITEEYGNGVKHVHIHNLADSVPVYVRARVDSNADTTTVSGEGWSDGGDGFWYYADIVPVDAEAKDLDVAITFPEETVITRIDAQGNKTEEHIPLEGGENIRVSVYYQAVPAAGYESAQAAFAGFAENANS